MPGQSHHVVILVPSVLPLAQARPRVAESVSQVSVPSKCHTYMAWQSTIYGGDQDIHDTVAETKQTGLGSAVAFEEIAETLLLEWMW
jgi:hypothetical protein